MKTLVNTLVVSILIFGSGTLFAASLTDEEKATKTIQKSVKALDNIMEDPENCIPRSLINDSEGIVIFPSAFKLALGFAGGQGGRGIALIRKEDGTWSNPFFVSLGEGSLGFQFGAQSSDIVLLFKNKDDIIDIDMAEVTLGSDVGVAAGPVSRGTLSTTDIRFDSEIYSYYHSKGLFAGVSLKGGILSYNRRYNEYLYAMDEVNSNDILNGIITPYNDQVDYLIEVIDIYSK